MRQDRSCLATLGSIEEACCGVPRRESKSDGVALEEEIGGLVVEEAQVVREEKDGQCEYEWDV